MLDLNEAEPQREFTIVPPGVYRLRAKVKPGGMGEDGALRLAKNMRTSMLELEHTIIGGEHEKIQGFINQKVWDRITVSFDDRDYDHPDVPALTQKQIENYRTSVRIGLSKLRMLLESAYAIDPTDQSEAAKSKAAHQKLFRFRRLGVLGVDRRQKGRWQIPRQQRSRLSHHAQHAGLAEAATAWRIARIAFSVNGGGVDWAADSV